MAEQSIDEALREALEELEEYERGSLPEYQTGSVGPRRRRMPTPTPRPGGQQRTTSFPGRSAVTPGPTAPAPASAPAQQPATPYGAAGETSGTLSQFGRGLLDPESDLSKRYMEELRENIGRQTEAQQRSAGYRAAQAGFGAGASPEALQMQTDIGVAGQEAAGQAASDFLMQAPQLGMRALTPALGANVTMRGQDLGARMHEQRQDLDYDRLMQEARLREMGYLYGALY